MDKMSYSEINLESADDFAKSYDQYVMERKWKGPDILFKVMKAYITSGQRLLDVGIGTGLCALLFQQAGLQIYGIDGSQEMLHICESKNIAKKLMQWDITNGLPNIKITFDHIISFAVLHMIEDLSPFFKGCKALLTKEGYLAFSVIKYDSEIDKEYKETDISGVYRYIDPESGIYSFRHSQDYNTEMLSLNGFTLLKKHTFLGFQDKEENREVYFTLFLTKNMN